MFLHPSRDITRRTSDDLHKDPLSSSARSSAFSRAQGKGSGYEAVPTRPTSIACETSPCLSCSRSNEPVPSLWAFSAFSLKRSEAAASVTLRRIERRPRPVRLVKGHRCWPAMVVRQKDWMRSRHRFRQQDWIVSDSHASCSTSAQLCQHTFQTSC